MEIEFNNVKPTQVEMKEILIAKINKYPNVDIKTKEVINNVGKYYAITAHIKLGDIGNCIFHSATLKTVSYNNRIVNIKCVFSDNENLKHDMKVNRDSLFQCFRDIAPDTITSISIEDFKDQSEKSHLRIIASTIKGASLIYIYKRLMIFVKIINDKYGNLINTPILPPIEISKSIEDKNIEVKNIEVKNIEVKNIEVKNIEDKNRNIISELKQEPNIEVQKESINYNAPIISASININFNGSENILKDLDKEEHRLQTLLDNIRLLKQTQLNYIKNSTLNLVTVTNPVTNPIAIPITNLIKNDTSENKDVPITPPTFASKVKQSIKM